MDEPSGTAEEATGGPGVREATTDDLPAIVAIFNQVVAGSAAIWRDEPASLADRQAWFERITGRGYPVLVATRDGGPVLGYASLTDFRDFPGYFPTVEHSIHVAEGHRGMGIGQALLDGLTQRARALGKQVMVAGLDAGNEGSLRFHRRAGFREVGRMPGIGRKFGRPVDLVLLQRDLPSEPPSPAAPHAGRLSTAVLGIHHVQLAMPPGGEAEAVAFYAGLLGVGQVDKPPHLAGRGGCWFEDGPIKVHLGVDPDFRPARKAHPALLVDDLPPLLGALRAAGASIVDDEPLDGFDRAYVDDPFGNRIELLSPLSPSA